MKKRWSVGLWSLSLVLGAGLLGGCAEEDDLDDVCEDDIVTRVDEDADFSEYETYAIWEIGSGMAGAGGGSSADIPDDVAVNIDTANKEAARQLRDLGLTQVDPEQEDPDLWIVSLAATQEETGTYWSCYGGWAWWGWYYYWDPCAWLVPIEFEYTEGTLLVATIDSGSHTAVFGGVVEGILECDDDLETRIESGVEEIFKDYPQE